MKTAVYFKHFLSAFAALVLLGVASSCKDQNFDWDKAHSSSAHEKFTDVFIKEFGKPQEGHDWGYNDALNALSGNLSSRTRAYFKLGENMPDGSGVARDVMKTRPVSITKEEHDEVYAWFSCHKVDWENNPSIVTDDGSRNFKDDEAVARYVTGNKVTLFNRNGGSDYSEVAAETQLGSLKNHPINCAQADRNIGNVLEYNNGWIQTVATNVREDSNYEVLFTRERYYNGIYNNKSFVFLKDNQGYYAVDYYGNPVYEFLDQNGQTVYCAKFTSAQKDKCKRTDDESNWAEWAGFNPSSEKMWKPLSNNTPMGSKWETFFYSIPEISNNKYPDQTGTLVRLASTPELSYSTYSITKAAHMDYLYAGEKNSGSVTSDEATHVKDFNGSYPGVGYQKEGGDDYSVVWDASLNNWMYSDSNGDEHYPHDKFIIVYLEGDNYAGYYLGFDYEGWSNSPGKPEGRIMADGYCNDWIFKISEALPTDEYNPCRIMCEDLGGITEATDSHPMASDIDYNDLVLDVEYDGNGDATLTLRAAGGTLPLVVTYDNKPLFETHEFFKNGIAWAENHTADKPHKMDLNQYSVMYNTGEESASYQVFKFGHVDRPSTSVCAGYQKLASGVKFDFEKLGVFVYRFSAEDYCANSSQDLVTLSNNAEWINVENQDDSAPLLLYLPGNGAGTPVKWLKERKSIKEGYQGFSGWVANKKMHFWTDSSMRNESLLMGN